MKNSLFILVALFIISASSCRKDIIQSPSNQNTLGITNSLNASSAKESINDGLVGYYPFFGNANDSTSYGNNGILEDNNAFGGGLGLPVLTKDKYGHQNSAYLFNGQSDYILLPKNPLLYNTVVDSAVLNSKGVTQFSIYARFKTDTTGTILETGDSHGGSPIQLTFRRDTVTFEWSFLFYKAGVSGSKSVVVSGHPASTTRHDWVDAVVNFSKSKVKLYLNGELAASSNTSFSDGGMFDQFYIGATRGTFPHFFFKGKIGEVRFYNRPLKDKEITYLLNHKKIQ